MKARAEYSSSMSFKSWSYRGDRRTDWRSKRGTGKRFTVSIPGSYDLGKKRALTQEARVSALKEIPCFGEGNVQRSC